MSLPWEDEPDAWWYIDGADEVVSSYAMGDAEPEDGWYRANPPSRYDTDVPVRYSMLDNLLTRARTAEALLAIADGAK